MDKFNLILVFISLFVCVNSWQKCGDTFCGELRKRPDSSRKVELNIKEATINNKQVKASLQIQNLPPLRFTLQVVDGSIFHMKIEDKMFAHFDPEEALVPDLQLLQIKATKNDTFINVIHGDNEALIYKNPFKVEFYNHKKLISIVNWKNGMIFNSKIQPGPIALDIQIVNVQRAYGLPEHAESLTLQNTNVNGREPYRLFNVDYGNYTVNSGEGLYGSIPVLYGHGIKQSSGIFWLNPSQTWVDITTSPNDIDAYFMSETGAINLFVLPGPTLQKAVTQYTKLTGTAPLPQYFALGYHQSRYSYMNVDEVTDVIEQFDNSKMPVDAVWLDIDYTDGKKYFTWDPKRFKNYKELLKNLEKKKRKLVLIIDPHIKVDKGYDVYTNAKASKYFIKNQDGTDYVAKCWPGDSSWLDFLNPAALSFYSDLYQKDGFDHAIVHIWNDMNEPAVFNDIVPELEKTMPGDLVHYNNTQHKELHNVYGFYQTKGTRTGLLDTNPNLRPFILTRSHFAGIQRYAAIWTGDNYASWEHLRISLPMCLTEALAGVSFCGADVGGFIGVPEDELYQRWYQVGAWLPFFRGHSAKDVPRREPYLYTDIIQNRVKTALHQRYSHLPLWYTLFKEHETAGEPVIRPITYHYSKDADTLNIDSQFLVGHNVLVAPVLEPQVHSINVYLPGGKSEIWYNIDDNNKVFYGLGYQDIPVNLNSTPVFYRGGSIIPRKNILRSTSVDTHKDPFTLYICLDKNGEANGTLYIDDYESFNYKVNDEFLYVKFMFKNNTLSLLEKKGNRYSPSAKINELIILNPPANITQVKYLVDDNLVTSTSVQYHSDQNSLSVTNITIDFSKEFEVKFGNNATILKLSSWLLAFIVISLLM